jgi:adenylosuccinate lyase
MLEEMTRVVDGLVVFPDRMRANLDALGGIAYSQGVMLALVDAGLSRDDAYRIVQRAAAAAWDEGASFRELVASDPEVAARLDPPALTALFEPSRFLRNLHPLFERLEKLPVEEGQA